MPPGTDDAFLPAATSDTLLIDFPTEAEKLETRRQHQVEWGGGLSVDDYLLREQYLETIPLAANGGIQGWILTERLDNNSSNRRVLATCETLQKRALSTDAAGTVFSDIAYGICTVFTDPRYRGRGYCDRLMRELRDKLRHGFETAADGQPIRPLASVLWSDIGRAYYAKRGWLPYDSFQVVFPVPLNDEDVALSGGSSVSSGSSSREKGDTTTRPSAVAVPSQDITLDSSSLEALAKLDGNLLRASMTTEAAQAKADASNTTCPLFALVPEHDTLRWSLYRDAWITQKLLPSLDALSSAAQRQKNDGVFVAGAVAGQTGARIWAIWTRSYNHDPSRQTAETTVHEAGGESDNINTLTIIRLVIEDNKVPPEQLTAAFAAVMARARRIAADWHLGQILLWNPDSTTKATIEASGLAHRLVERQGKSIPSLLWYGDETDKVRWVANEKFGWC